MAGKFCYYLLLGLIIISTCLISCEKDKNLKVDHFPLVKLRYNDVSIKKLPLYGIHGFVLNDSAYAAFFNNRSLELVIMNFERADRLPRTVKLNDTVLQSKKFGPIHRFSICENDKLAFIQESRFGLYDLITHNIEFQKPNEGNDSLPIFFNFAGSYIPMHYIDSLNEFYIECVDFRKPQNDKKYIYDMMFHYKTNILKDEFSLIPVKFPRSWGNGELGMSAQVSCIYQGDSIIYNFSNLDSLLIYDKGENTESWVKAKSSHHKDIIPVDSLQFKSIDKQRELKSLNFVYNSILFDKWKNCYYRVYSRDQPLKDEEGFFNTAKNRKEGVIVMDTDFNVVGEFQIPEETASVFCVTKKGLTYMVPQTPKDSIHQLEGYLKYAAINVDL